MALPADLTVLAQTAPTEATKSLSRQLPSQPPPPRRSLRRRIAAAELGELPSRLNTNEKLNRVPDQRGSFTDSSEFLGAREQVIIECHSGSHGYLHTQDSITNSII